eukprot:Hpha_TRINITY_DN8764_c0_g1::TRINITY_DN8764_c0_g1_i1::g.45102::m.45102
MAEEEAATPAATPEDSKMEGDAPEEPAKEAEGEGDDKMNGEEGAAAPEEEEDIMKLLEEDDFEDFVDDKWGKEKLDPGDATGMWNDAWLVPEDDEPTLLLKAALQQAKAG